MGTVIIKNDIVMIFSYHRTIVVCIRFWNCVISVQRKIRRDV